MSVLSGASGGMFHFAPILVSDSLELPLYSVQIAEPQQLFIIRCRELDAELFEFVRDGLPIETHDVEAAMIHALAPQLGAAPQFDRSRDQNQDRDRICVYQDINYQGWEQCYSAGEEVADFGKRRNAISSIRVYGRARVTVYEDQDFEGKSAEFSSDVRDLGLRSLSGSKSWSDHIQSLRVSSDYNRNRDQSNRYPNQRQQQNDGILCIRPARL